MAVNEMQNPSSLRIKLDLGMVDGKTKVRSKTFSTLKTWCTCTKCIWRCRSFNGLQEYDTIEIAKIDNTTLAYKDLFFKLLYLRRNKYGNKQKTCYDF